MQANNLTLNEFINLNRENIDPVLVQKIEESQTLKAQIQENKEVQSLNRQLEIAQEQAYFGRELVENIKEICKNNTRAKEMKKEIKVAIENSMFEL